MTDPASTPARPTYLAADVDDVAAEVDDASAEVDDATAEVDDVATDTDDPVAGIDDDADLGSDDTARDQVATLVTIDVAPDDGLHSVMAAIEEAEGVLGDVDTALERLEAGKYRTCEICGAALEAEALVTTPTLRRCVTHAG